MLEHIRRFIRQLYCVHAFVKHRDISGDEINQVGAREEVICLNCGKKKFRRFL